MNQSQAEPRPTSDVDAYAIVRERCGAIQPWVLRNKAAALAL